MKKLLKNYKHIVYFFDQKELHNKIKYYQNNINYVYKIPKLGNRFFINHLSIEKNLVVFYN